MKATINTNIKKDLIINTNKMIVRKSKTTSTKFVPPQEIPYALAVEKGFKATRTVYRPYGKTPRTFVFNGNIYCLKTLAKMFGFNYITLNKRITRGWSPLRAFCTENHRVDHYITTNLELISK